MRWKKKYEKIKIEASRKREKSIIPHLKPSIIIFIHTKYLTQHWTKRIFEIVQLPSWWAETDKDCQGPFNCEMTNLLNFMTSVSFFMRSQSVLGYLIHPTPTPLSQYRGGNQDIFDGETENVRKASIGNYWVQIEGNYQKISGKPEASLSPSQHTNFALKNIKKEGFAKVFQLYWKLKVDGSLLQNQSGNLNGFFSFQK